MFFGTRVVKWMCHCSLTSPAFLPVAGTSSINHTQKLLFFNSTNNNEWNMSQYTFNNGTKSSNSGNPFDAWNIDTVTDDRSQLLTWLSPLNPGLRHWDIQERRFNDIGGWLLETEEFRRWHASGEGGDGESAVLFCHGDPGVGKTFIR